MMDDFRQLRHRQDGFRDDLDRLERGNSPGTATMIGTVYNAGAMPTALPGRFAVHVASASGAESEGAAVAVAATGKNAVMTVIGTKVPVVGDVLIAKLIGGHWVARRGSSGGGTHGFIIPGCPCTNIPGVLNFKVKKLAPPWLSGVYPDTLTRRAQPVDLARYATDPVGYYGDHTFTSLDGFYKYRYWFSCQDGVYYLSGYLTADSVAGFPNRFIIMSWLVGLPGNICTPFTLTNGATQNTTFQEQGISITP